MGFLILGPGKDKKFLSFFRGKGSIKVSYIDFENIHSMTTSLIIWSQNHQQTNLVKMKLFTIATFALSGSTQRIRKYLQLRFRERRNPWGGGFCPFLRSQWSIFRNVWSTIFGQRREMQYDRRNMTKLFNRKSIRRCGKEPLVCHRHKASAKQHCILFWFCDLVTYKIINFLT